MLELRAAAPSPDRRYRLTQNPCEPAHLAQPANYESEMWELLVHQVVEWLDRTRICSDCKDGYLRPQCQICDGSGRTRL